MIQKQWFWTLPVVLMITGALAAVGVAQNVAKEKEFRIERSMPKEAIACIECHKREHPAPTSPAMTAIKPKHLIRT